MSYFSVSYSQTIILGVEFLDQSYKKFKLTVILEDHVDEYEDDYNCTSSAEEEEEEDRFLFFPNRKVSKISTNTGGSRTSSCNSIQTNNSVTGSGNKLNNNNYSPSRELNRNSRVQFRSESTGSVANNSMLAFYLQDGDEDVEMREMKEGF